LKKVLKNRARNGFDYIRRIILASGGWSVGLLKSRPNALTGETQLALAA
jgi:hypothetical protein